MSSRGAKETELLKSNIESQLNRLLAQLQDLEELRNDLDEDEYQETRNDTVDQLKEFQESLKKMMKGNMTLVDDLNAVQLAIQAAISDAFKTPDVIRMFAKKQDDLLRKRLEGLKRQKLPAEAYAAEACEILLALQKLGQNLSPDEQMFLNTHSTDKMTSFIEVGGELGAASKKSLLSAAGTQVRQAQK